MKILAQSLVPTTPIPYLHLGYTAAAAETPQALGCFGFLITWTVGYYILSKYWKRSRLAMITAIILMAVGVLFIKQGFIESKVAAEALRVRMTKVYLGSLRRFVSNAILLGETIPPDIPSIRQEWELPESSTRDGWKRELRFDVDIDDSEKCYVLTSAGKDGLFDSYDDIRLIIKVPAAYQTDMRLDSLATNINEASEAGKALPRNMEEVQRLWDLAQVDTQDGWGHAMRLQKVKGKVLPVSAGPDGKFGTGDDRTPPHYTKKNPMPEPQWEITYQGEVLEQGGGAK